MQFRSILVPGALASLLLTMTTGCSSVQKGAAAGGAVGAVAGAITGHNVGTGAASQGALIGASAGVATGGLAGDAFEKVEDSDLERELENLRAQLMEREQELAALQDAGASAESLAELEGLRAELNGVRGQLRDANSQLASAGQANTDLNRLRNELNAAKNGNSSQLRQMEDRLVEKDKKISDLGDQLKTIQSDYDLSLAEKGRFENELQSAKNELSGLKNKMQIIEASLIEKESAVENLRSEMEKLDIELQETSRGLTLTIVDQLLFTPGKAQLSDDGAALIAKVGEILRTNFPGREFVVEGHTDNQPIVHSGWRSNWELGAGRALTVVHELIDIHGFTPEQLSATTYGEHRPDETNATPGGRAQNRRSVIVILPEKVEVKRAEFAGLPSSN